MIKNDTLKRKVVCLHIFKSQDNTVDRAKTGIGDKDTGKSKFPDHIFKLDLALIKTERAEDPTASFHRDVVIVLSDFRKTFVDNSEVNRISLHAGGKVW